MKYLSSLLLVCSLFFAFDSVAQDSVAENEGWLINLDEAYAESKETGKPIMANFTGSDWCGWCKKLKRDVFVHDEFKQWAEENVVLLELDFPRRKKLPADLVKQNRSLQQAFGVRGYPTIWVFFADKNDKGEYNIEKLGRIGYKNNVGDFVGGVNEMISRYSNGE